MAAVPSSLRSLAAIALLACMASPALAQGTGRLEGTVIDSVHGRPLAGVRVIAVGAPPRLDVGRNATSDSTGRYRIDSLPPGKYLVGFESPLLDSLEMTLPPRETTIETGRPATLDLAMPSATRLRSALCPGVALRTGTGVVYGHVTAAESENPLAGAKVAMMWRELDVDRTTLRPINAERSASVITDDGGWYRVCGVPTGAWMTLQVQHEGRVGAALRTHVDDTLGIAIRHISYSSSSARDSSVDATTTTTASLTGTATVTGIVSGPDGRPVPLAEVRVRGARAEARTDASGGFTLAGLPSGTQTLEVRRIGYELGERSVDLRSGATTTSDVRLRRVVVTLDSMRVTALRSRYTEFEAHRKRGIGGRFIDPTEMEWQRKTSYTSNIAEKFPSFRVIGEGPKAVVISDAFGRPCAVNIVIDGFEDQAINDITPGAIGAMEVYRPGDILPPEVIHSNCGAIMIWTQRGR